MKCDETLSHWPQLKPMYVHTYIATACPTTTMYVLERHAVSKKNPQETRDTQLDTYNTGLTTDPKVNRHFIKRTTVKRPFG